MASLRPGRDDDNDAHGVNLQAELTANPAYFADTTFQAYADKIAADYTLIIKTLVMPQLEGLGPVKLRDLRILTSLSFYSAALSPRDISKILRYDPATVTRSVTILESEALVRKIENKTDQRGYRLSLTQAGDALAERYKQLVQTAFKDIEGEMARDLSLDDKIHYLNIIRRISKRAETMRNICLQKG